MHPPLDGGSGYSCYLCGQPDGKLRCYLHRPPALLLGVYLRSALSVAGTLPGNLLSCHRPLSDDISLKLRKSQEGCQNQPPYRGILNHTHIEDVDAHSPLHQFPAGGRSLHHCSGKSIKFAHHQGITLFQQRAKVLELWPVHPCASKLLLDDKIAPLLPELVALLLQAVSILFCCAVLTLA